ncbi:pre-toxin TG domain-containing protein [Cytobacillus horneckiae]|uniref:pre-toxin TG domain-containing protein n=1 Tax=Cytobacillus horneckiae TaxID=549687 RepID=UPI003B8A8B73
MAEAISGKDFITGREIGYLERGALVAAIFGGPIVKGATKVVKWGGKHLSKLKNVFTQTKSKPSLMTPSKPSPKASTP